MQLLFGMDKEGENMKTVEMVRLIADEGKVLVKGDVEATCVDTFAEDKDNWSEKDAPKEEAEEKVVKEEQTEEA